MTELFLSYAQKDRERVRHVRNIFAAEGYEVWWDEELPPGAVWHDWVTENIRTAKCTFVFWSKYAVESANLIYEVRLARKYGNLVAVVLDDLAPTQYPMGSYSADAINLVGWDGTDAHAGWRKLKAKTREKTGKGFRVFISYSRKDVDVALKIAQRLREGGFNIWLDQLDIPAGTNWDRAIETALQYASVVLTLLTPSSVASENVRDEISYALGSQIPILPLLISPCAMPLRLHRLQYVDFSRDFEGGLLRCQTELRRMLATTG